MSLVPRRTGSECIQFNVGCVMSFTSNVTACAYNTPESVKLAVMTVINTPSLMFPRLWNLLDP